MTVVSASTMACLVFSLVIALFFFQAEDGIRDYKVTGVQTCALPIWGSLLPLLLAIEDCPKPTVAAIHGTAFGGGLEVAMAFHYRVAAPAAQVGQPEIGRASCRERV